MEQQVREPRAEKVAVVAEVRDRFEASNAAILTEYRGLSVADLEALRRQLRAAGGEYKVYKNTLVRRAVTEAGLESLVDLLVGPTGIAFVDADVAAVAKVLRDFARANPHLVLKGGLIGESLIDERGAAALAELPTREQMLAQFAGLLASPMRQLAALMKAVPQRLAYGLSALVAERQSGEPAASSGEQGTANEVSEQASTTGDSAVEDALGGASSSEEPTVETTVEDDKSTASTEASEQGATEPIEQGATEPTEPTEHGATEPTESPS